MRLSLRTQILAALVTLALLFIGALWLQVRSFEQGVHDQALISNVRTLAARVDDIERRGRGYAAVAPRDFESYRRDVAVIYSGWKEDLTALDQSLESVGRDASNGSGMIGMYFEQLAAQYREFREGLADKLGDDEQEPRLEWGAEFLVENAPALQKTARDLDASVSAIVADHLATARRNTQYTWIVSALILTSMGVWFWFRVTRRIQNVSAACRAVAEGAFGTRAPEGGNDELGDLSRAFNQLSSRTRVVLGVLDKLPENATPEDAFGVLWSESREHLGQRWQGLFEIEATGDASVASYREEPGVDFASAGTRYGLEGVMQMSGLDHEDYALIADIRRHTLGNADGRLLRELSRRDLRTLALVRIRDPKLARQRILMLGWKEAASEETGVARFLSGLARFLGRALTPTPHALAGEPA